MAYQANNNARRSDDDYFEEDENLAFLPADHPLMIRLQEALKKTLEKDHETVHLKLREKEANLKALDRSKEDVAVQLYGVQQSLAELHTNLEQSHDNFNLIQKLRVDAEEKLSVLSQQFNSKQEQMKGLDRNLIKTQDELSKIARTVKQIEDYNESIKSEIKVTKTTTYRAEENIAKQEQTKKNQDFLLDNLTEQKKRLNEQIVIIEAQLLAQKDETKAAQDILREAYNEMESISTSKKNLLERWQQSLLEMQRRDKALQVAREALKTQLEINVQINAEIAGVGNDLKRHAAYGETLAANLNRLTMEEKHLDEERKKLDHEQSKLLAQIKILQQSLQSTESSAQVIERECKKVVDQQSIIEENIMKIHSQTTSLYEQIIVKINDHKTLEKKSANFLKQAQTIEREMDDKETEKEEVDNEVARVGIDTLNTMNQIESLKQKKREVSEERKKKEETVATYDLEIRQGHDINEKKQSEVGKLNKLHDEIMASTSEVARGPQEAHKNHLLNQIKEKTEQNQYLERDWIKKQTSLVKQQQYQEKISEEVSSLRTKKTVLDQKKMRLNTLYANYEKEIKEVRISLKNFQTEMNKLNDGIAKNQGSETKLTNDNYHVQSEFVEKLKELESVNVKLEIDIDRLKEEKAELLQTIVEAERQLYLWERKIQLEKEMQEALDPNVGQSELTLLKKEIHRMELRLDELRKRQEVIIGEMERAVHKREAIQLKYVKSHDDDNDKKNSRETRTRIEKQIRMLKDNLAQSTKQNKDIDLKIRQIQAELDQKNDFIQKAEHATQYTEKELTGKMTEINQMKVQKTANIFEIVKIQTKSKAYESLSINKFKFEAPEAQLRQRYKQQKELNFEMLDVLKEALESNPQYAEVIEGLVNIKA